MVIYVVCSYPSMQLITASCKVLPIKWREIILYMIYMSVSTSEQILISSLSFSKPQSPHTGEGGGSTGAVKCCAFNHGCLCDMKLNFTYLLARNMLFFQCYCHPHGCYFWLPWLHVTTTCYNKMKNHLFRLRKLKSLGY